MTERFIWKYPLTMSLDEQTVEMPQFRRIRHFAMQGDVPTIWAEVDPTEPRAPCRFMIVGTGHPIPENSIYEGTTFDGPSVNGMLVWHLYAYYTPANRGTNT